MQLVSFYWSNNTGAIDMKMDGSVFEEKLLFKMLGLTFSSKLHCSLYIVSIAKTVSKKIGALICSIQFLFFLRFLCISINLPQGHAWNTVALSGLLLLVATQNCQISYKDGYAGRLVLHLLPLLNSLSPFCRYCFCRCSSELAQLVPLPYSGGRSTLYSDRLHDFSVAIPRCYKDIYVNSFFPRTAKLL